MIEGAWLCDEEEEYGKIIKCTIEMIPMKQLGLHLGVNSRSTAM